MKLSHLLLASLALLACGASPGKKKKANMPHATDKASSGPDAAPVKESGRPVLLGWYCPTMAAGRAGIRPLFAKDPTWSSEMPPLEQAIASRRVKRFSVLAWQGHRAGSLTVAGAAQDSGGKMAIGSYLGASACLPQSSAGDSAGKRGDEDPLCLAISRGCAPALGALEAAGGFKSRPYEEDPEQLDLFRGAACEADDLLTIDLDGDGQAEHFSIADLRSPEAPVELPLADKPAKDCATSASASFAASVRGHADLVRMAVLDVDGDGRLELLYRRNDNEFLLYGAPTSPARLELLGRQGITKAP
jgi:hypothetical protein